MWFNMIRDYYKLGLYTSAQVQVFVAAGWISAEEADTIIVSEVS